MNHIKKLVAQFEHQKILVVGDVMIDTYLLGKVDRISPEAPVPVVFLKEEQNRLGGAGNVALNIASLGGEVVLCSVIGDDDNGVLFKDLMNNENLDLKGILSSTSRKTTMKSRVFAGGQQLLRLDSEDTHSLSKVEEDAFLKRIEHILKDESIDVILFQDYNKGVLTVRVIKKLIEWAQSKNIQTVVDPKMDNFFAYKGVTLFKPNLKEISESMGQQIEPTQAGLDKAVEVLMAQINCSQVVVTLSEKGIYVNDSGQSYMVTTTTKSVSDVSGAGDTVISVLALGIAAKGDLKEIVSLSNKAAGIVCGKLGVVPITGSELLK